MSVPKRFLHLVALLVPRTQRAEWLREWQAELAALRAEEPTNEAPSPEMKALRLAQTILRDALALRRHLPGGRPRIQTTPFGGRRTGSSPNATGLHHGWHLGPWVLSFSQDVRFALRALRRAPLFSGLSLFVLTMAFTAVATISVLVSGLLLHPLPYPDAERLAMVWEDYPERPASYSTSPQTFRDWHDSSEPFSGLAAYGAVSRAWQTSEGPENIVASAVSADYFRLLGVDSRLGRWLGSADVEPTAARTVVLSHAFWSTRLGSDPTILGQSLILDGQPHRIVGLMPEDFWHFDPYSESEPLLWVPLEQQDWSAIDRGDRLLRVVGRLADGVALGRARDEMQSVARAISAAHPDTHEGWGIDVVSMHKEVVKEVRFGLLVVAGTVIALLLVACSNVANLVLARAVGRGAEVAVRRALGAGRLRIMRLQLTEILILTLSGAALGTLLAAWSVGALVHLWPTTLPLASRLRLEGDVAWAMLALALLVAVALGVVSQVGPRRSAESILRASRRSMSEGRTVGRLRNMIVTAEVALSMVMLCFAALLLHSYLRLALTDPGFDPRGVLTFGVSLPASGASPDPASPANADFFGELRRQLEQQPGVVAVGATSHLPFSGWNMTAYVRRDDAADVAGGDWSDADQRIEVRRVTAGYLDAIGLRLLAGRGFQEGDRADSEPVVIVNEVMGQLLFGDGDAFGKTLLLSKGGDTPRRVVGVVAGVKHHFLGEPRKPIAYVPVPQYPGRSLRFVARATADPFALVGSVRAVLRDLDPDQPPNAIASLDALVGDSLSTERFYSTLLGLFAALAMALAAVGIVGVVTLSVNRRVHEIGIRVAIGAPSRSVVALIVRQTMAPVIVGLGGGGLAALAGARVLDSLLYEISTTDAATLATAALLLGAVALTASWLPARRALRIDPIEALRSE